MRRLTSENKERKYKMAKILISPSKYLQGAGEMKNLGTYAAKSGKKALVLISKGGYKRIGKTIEESFAESTCEVVFDYFNGECCNSEIDRLVKIVKDEQCDLTIGIGGGKIFDTARQLHTMREHRYLSVRRSHLQMPLAVLCLLFIQKKEFLKNICFFRRIRILF